MILFKSKKKVKYDKFSSFCIDRKNMFLKYETDMITFPAEKKIMVMTNKNKFFWICNFKKNFDAVIYYKKDKKITKLFKKN